jgi:hypothetical protein
MRGGGRNSGAGCVLCFYTKYEYTSDLLKEYALKVPGWLLAAGQASKPPKNGITPLITLTEAFLAHRFLRVKLCLQVKL